MPTNTYSTRNPAVSGASPNSAPTPSRRSATALRLALPVLGSILTACQPAVHNRQAITPAWSSVAGFVSQSGPSRMRVGEYTVAGLRASAATRHWPLMDSRTLSHRYGFDVQKDGGQQQGVQCVLITISGDEARDRTSLDCTVQGGAGWRIALSGRVDFDGTITGSSRHYTVRSTDPDHESIAGRAGRRSGYRVLDSDSPVAVVEFDSGGDPWIDPKLDEVGQDVVAATVVALLVGHELERGGR
jgi:hypothetical protein